MTLLYNLVMLAVDVLAVRLLLRRKSLLAWCGAMLCAAAIASAWGGLLGGCFENHFGIIRLYTYAVFLHGAALLAATAVLWRKSRPLLAVGAGLCAVAVVAIAVDAFRIEPFRLEVTHVRIASPKIKKPLRIVVVADLQTDRIGQYEIDALQRVLDEKPDIILFAGDYIQVPGNQQVRMWAELHSLLMKMKICATSRAFAVRGNIDAGMISLFKIFEDTGVTVIKESRSFDLPELRLTCLEQDDAKNPMFVVTNPTPDRFHLVLGHTPNFALGKIDADLLVAGHTHGGQVCIPWIGPLIIHSPVPLSWAAGLTDLPGGAKLLVSRGIGMERGYAPQMRFLCRPELTVIELTPEEKSE